MPSERTSPEFQVYFTILNIRTRDMKGNPRVGRDRRNTEPV